MRPRHLAGFIVVPALFALVASIAAAAVVVTEWEHSARASAPLGVWLLGVALFLAFWFALAAMVYRFHYLKYALAAVLLFIGAKIFVSDFVLDGGKFPPLLSLGVTVALLAGGVIWSLWKTRGEERAASP